MADKSVDYQGSFFIAEAINMPLVWRITASEDAGPMQRYAENPVSEAATHYSLVTGEYVEDANGIYIEDPAHPGRYILRAYEENSAGAYVYDPIAMRHVEYSEHAGQGKYASLKDVLKNSGVVFLDG